MGTYMHGYANVMCLVIFEGTKNIHKAQNKKFQICRLSSVHYTYIYTYVCTAWHGLTDMGLEDKQIK